MTGYDHAMFFILYEKGSAFNGTKGESTYKPLQTPLEFKRVSDTAGYKNNAFQLVHYRKDKNIETIQY